MFSLYFQNEQDSFSWKFFIMIVIKNPWFIYHLWYRWIKASNTNTGFGRIYSIIVLVKILDFGP